MANIARRGKYWRVRIRRLGFPDQTRSFDSRANAERWARSVEADIDKGAFVDRSATDTTTLREILERYRREVTPSKRGAESESLRLNAMARKPFADMRMSGVTSTYLATFRDQRLRDVKPGTVNREFNILSHVIETARREWGIHLQENPCRLVRRAPQPRARDRRLTPAEANALLDACKQSRRWWLTPIMRLAIETAMRRGELLSLEWKHVDLEKRYAHLPITKNGEARTVPLSTTAVALLRAIPRSINGNVFPGVTGEALKQSFERAVERAAIENLHFHDLRHEATSRFFERGLNIMEVASVTGHKTLQMLKRYTHLRVADLAEKLG